jgi:CelD/BcsL family acetyltransferase involved in cellulose biosynthesis
MTGAARYSDLRATVSPGEVPDGAAQELRELYGSLFATVDWFVTHDDAVAMGTCTLEDPRHVVLFEVEGDTVEVLNKAFAIAPEDVSRACRALFRALPRTRRIHFEVMFSPRELRLPKRVLYWTDHMIIPLPDTVAQYQAQLGKSTRRNLRTYENRLSRDFPGMRTEVVAPGEDARAHVDLFLRWKMDRFGVLGRDTYWEKDPQLVDRFVALLQRCGEVRMTTLAGSPVAVVFAFPVGAAVCAQEAAFDTHYEYYHLGLLAWYWLACDAIARGLHSMNLLWGTATYKERLGAVPQRATTVSVFRHQTDRFRSLDEAREVAARRLRRSRVYYYSRARHWARRLIKGK